LPSTEAGLGLGFGLVLMHWAEISISSFHAKEDAVTDAVTV